MTKNVFRKLALSMPEATEGEHMGHPDFRVGGKIFATLTSTGDQDFGMVSLTPARQRDFIESVPDVFRPVKGGWGKRGATQVDLDAAKSKATPVIREALFAAWSKVAPKKLLEGE